MYKFVFYVPLSHKETVKDAVFATGAGKIGNYDRCCWETAGCGQFRPLPGATPYIGSQNEVEQVEEYRVELVCNNSVIEAAVRAMKQAHPYEEPAYDAWQLADY